MTSLFLGLSIFGAFQVPETLTLDEALKIASQNSFTIRLAERDMFLAEQNYRQVTGQLGPQINLGGNYSYSDSSNSSDPGSKEFKQFQTTVTKIIDITGIAKHGVTASKLLRDAAKQTFLAQTNSVKRTVRTNFFDVLQSNALVSVQQDELKSSADRLKNAKLRFDAGDVSEFDVLRLETEVKRSEQALVESDGNYQIAKQKLNDSIGRDVNIDFVPADVPDDKKSTLPFEVALGKALESRPDVASNELAYDSFRHIRLAHEGASLPVFSVGATWTNTIDPFPGQNANGGQAFVQFSAPLYTSGVTRARASAAKAEEDKAKISLERTKSQVALDVKTAVTQIETSQKSFEVAITGQALAKEALRLAQLRYDEGAGILLDVTTAQSELTRAVAAVVTTRYQYLTAIASLQNAVGIDEVFTTKTTETKIP